MIDNGRKFADSQFIEMCENLGIILKTTAAESPWSNGLVERHNMIISEMLDKVILDSHVDLELALS